MNNVFDGVFIMKISEKVLKFLNREDVQGALARNDTQELYKLAESLRLSALAIGGLTNILIQAGIDPLLNMTEIPAFFLYKQKDIKEFNIPQGITTIGPDVFAHTDLENITIPNSVRVIDTGAFYKCENLKTVKLPVGVQLLILAFFSTGLESIELEDVKLQDAGIFEGCEQLKSVIIKGNTPVIPYHTFENCTDLTHVELPEALEQVEYDVFHGCKKLRKINFACTMDRWKDIEIDKDNRKLFSCKIICSDGTLKFDKTAKDWIEI